MILIFKIVAIGDTFLLIGKQEPQNNNSFHVRLNVSPVQSGFTQMPLRRIVMSGRPSALIIPIELEYLLFVKTSKLRSFKSLRQSKSGRNLRANNLSMRYYRNGQSYRSCRTESFSYSSIQLLLFAPLEIPISSYICMSKHKVHYLAAITVA